MIFKKMNLHNFRQFKGDTEIKFSTDPIKNVTVILGDNTSGKTTLMQAFNWCLYNQVNLENPDEIITNEVIKKIDIGENTKVEVSLEFEHLKKTYTCRNYIIYTRKTNGNIQKIDEAQIYTISDPETGETRKTTQSVIKEIFPMDLSSYFLFDGERMQSLVDNQKIGKKDLSNAVKNLLGLDVLENMQKHLNKAKKEFSLEIKAEERNQINLENINKSIEENENIIENSKKELEKLEEEIIEIEVEQNKISEIIKSYASLKELQEKRLDLQNRIDKQGILIEQQKSDIFKTFGTTSMNYFIGKNFDKLINKIKKTKLSDKGIDGINANAIETILKRGKCICGCNLLNDKDATENLIELKKYLPPESYSVLLKALEVKINNISENNGRYYENFNKMYKNYNDLIEQQFILKNNLEETEKKIAVTGDRDLSEYNEKYIYLRDKHKQKILAQGSLKERIETKTNKLHSLEDQRSQYAAKNKVNDIVNLKMDICDDLIEKVTRRLNEKETEVKNNLQEKVSKLLSEMLNSNKTIIIGDEYNFIVEDEYGTTANSEGEKVVISFAFVGAIISIAKKFIMLNNKEHLEEQISEMDDDKFTLVMDAPFAKLDEKHSKNVTSIIPELTDQIILFSVDKQWNGTVKNTLAVKTGKMYEIKKYEASSTVVELEKGVI